MKNYLINSFFTVVMSLFLFNGTQLWADDVSGDSKALSAIATIDENEMSAAQNAIDKNTDKDVVDYAQMMKKDHSANLDKAMQISKSSGISLQETSEVKALREKGKKSSETLAPLIGKEYSQAYITAMVNGHTEALDLIDHELSPNLQDKNVKDFVEKTRKHVAMHLNKAKKIQHAQEKG